MSTGNLAERTNGTTSLQPPGAGRSEQTHFAWRVLILMNLFRLLLGLILFTTYQLVSNPRIVGEADPELALAALLGLIAFSCIELVLLQKRTPAANVQVYLQFAADVIGITLLVHASGGISSGIGGLLVVSVGGLSLLVPVDRAFLLAALTTLALLVEQSFAQLRGLTAAAQFAPTGILGAVVFVITSVVQLLRRQVVETAALAEQRGVDLRNVVELNEYIIQHLRESIVVVDADDQIRLINESAIKQIAGSDPRRDQKLSEISADLANQLGDWRRGTAHDSATLSSADGSTTIRPHFASLGNSQTGGVVIFLEDTSLIEDRVQQAKLAALGRLSASIAHEIRNPLGAMSHASQLLAESSGIGDSERRLTDIISVNAHRVSNIVESVLALSRRDKTQPERLQLAPWLDDFAREFVQTLELYEDAVTAGEGSPDLEVLMDPTHLHQIVWNLCDNAVKYASAAAGAIAVELNCGYAEPSRRPYLEVADRGPGIDPNKVEQIFEPFYTGQPSGTGLGLYISRELAERNGATLRYYPRPGGGSVFRLVFADPSRWQPVKDRA